MRIILFYLGIIGVYSACNRFKNEFITLASNQQLKVVNREKTIQEENGVKYIHFIDEREGEGLVWLPVKDLSKGVIEVKLRGKDVFQSSFVGIAFHGLNDSTYDAVYCRPFNFLATDSVRRIHAIQYVSMPAYGWKRLREERNAIFEKEIKNPPDPNGWFTLKLVIGDHVSAYINDQKTPALTIEKLTNSTSGKLGLFMGDISGGDFEYIKIQYL